MFPVNAIAACPKCSTGELRPCEFTTDANCSADLIASHKCVSSMLRVNGHRAAKNSCVPPLTKWPQTLRTLMQLRLPCCGTLLMCTSRYRHCHRRCITAQAASASSSPVRTSVDAAFVTRLPESHVASYNAVHETVATHTV